MAVCKDGSKPTLIDIRLFADKLESKLLQLQHELAEAETMRDDGKMSEGAIELLTKQQDRMAMDMREMNQSLQKMADAISNLAVLEQKHLDAMDAIKRAHNRIDRLELDFKEGGKEYSSRLHKIEIHAAQNIWVERVVMVIVVTALGIWAQGGL